MITQLADVNLVRWFELERLVNPSLTKIELWRRLGPLLTALCNDDPEHG